ncbi:hypothetical protein Btru_008161 [Bulinus truncatus]|nr:hypothetical protein Btru_008161 [Bulinus truncatus]
MWHKEDGTKITVRDCSDKDWGSHCGGIRYFTGDQEQMVYGCLEACAHDGCNGASAQAPTPPLITLLASSAVLIFTWRNLWRTMTS